MDIGHSAQNVYLQAEAMGLGTCAVGAFNDAHVKSTVDLKGQEVPLYLLPLGVPAARD
jgi:nitroreductase